VWPPHAWLRAVKPHLRLITRRQHSRAAVGGATTLECTRVPGLRIYEPTLSTALRSLHRAEMAAQVSATRAATSLNAEPYSSISPNPSTATSLRTPLSVQD
jgi:hypothetical protein